VIVDAPMILYPADLAETFGSDLDSGEAAPGAADPALTPRAWWKTDAGRTRADGLEESMLFLRDVLRGARFDVRRARLCAR
jgi:hypothetical protein